MDRLVWLVCLGWTEVLTELPHREEGAKSAGLVSERCQNRSGSVWLMEAQAQDRMATARATGLVGGSFQPEEGRHYVTPVAHLAITRARF